MSATPYQTYLAERLQSARGLGWEMPLNPPLQKGGVVVSLLRALGFAR